MDQPRGGQRLAAEARDEGRIVGEVLGQQLQRDVALETLVEGEHDRGHPADAEAALDPVAPGDRFALEVHGVAPPPTPVFPVSPVLPLLRPAPPLSGVVAETARSWKSG